MTEIYLVRHPETPYNADGTVVGGRSNHLLLSPRGEQQVGQFIEAYAKSYPAPDILYSSPALRTRALAEAYLESRGGTIPYYIEDALQEMSQGDAEGKPRLETYTPEVLERINTELFDFKHPNGESLNDVSDRILGLIWKMHKEHPGQTILAATHGQTIRRLVGSLLGWSHYETTMDPSKVTPNVSLTSLSVEDEGIEVNFMGKEII